MRRRDVPAHKPHPSSRPSLPSLTTPRSSNQSKPLEEWTKVQLMDDDVGAMHVINLQVYEAATEEEALNLLFLGNMNRVTSATPMNQV